MNLGKIMFEKKLGDLAFVAEDSRLGQKRLLIHNCTACQGGSERVTKHL